jgi:hypothetical protein
MKFIINILLIMPSLSGASLIDLYHVSRPSEASYVRDLFNQKGVPLKSIKTIYSRSCQQKKSGHILTICINKKGKLILLSLIYKRLKSLRSFRSYDIGGIK